MKEQTPGKTKAILAYVTFLGFLIAASMNSTKKDLFATWHIKNSFGIILIWIVSYVTQLHINILTGDILQITSIVCLLYSLVMAMRDKKQGVPILSEKFQQWFTFLD